MKLSLSALVAVVALAAATPASALTAPHVKGEHAAKQATFLRDHAEKKKEPKKHSHKHKHKHKAKKHAHVVKAKPKH